MPTPKETTLEQHLQDNQFLDGLQIKSKISINLGLGTRVHLWRLYVDVW